MNEHYPSASDDPAPDTDAETQPGPAASRSRRLPRAGRVAAAATGRTAGWMVAAALAGSLVTLLLVPDNTTIIPVHRAAFSLRGGPSAVHRRHFSITLPAHAKLAPAPAGGQPFVHVSRRGQVFIPGGVHGPARMWVQVPANVPRCAFFPGPGFRPPAKIQIYRRGRRIIGGSISRPRRRPFQIVRPPAFRRIHRVVPSGGPRRQIVIQGGRPGQKVFVGRRAFAFGGPGGLGGLGCAMLMPGNFVGPSRLWWPGVAPSRTSWWNAGPPSRTSWYIAPAPRTSWRVMPAPRTSRASG